MERSNRVAIIIPAYNEEDSIVRVIESALHFAPVIVVDDGSSDQTASCSESCGALVVRHEVNQGYEGALATGLKKGFEQDYEFAITLDADGQHDTSLIATFIEAWQEGADLVLGVRPKPARWSEWLFCKLTYLFFSVKDPLSGMKGYSVKAYEQIGEYADHPSLGTLMILRAIQKRVLYSEVRIPISDRSDQARLGNWCSANMRILRSLLSSYIAVLIGDNKRVKQRKKSNT